MPSKELQWAPICIPAHDKPEILAVWRNHVVHPDTVSYLDTFTSTQWLLSHP